MADPETRSRSSLIQMRSSCCSCWSGQRRHPGLCAHRDAAGRDRGPQRARRQPRPDRRAALRRSARARGRCARSSVSAWCRWPPCSSTRRSVQLVRPAAVLVTSVSRPTACSTPSRSTVLAAAIVGVVPALKATGGVCRRRLQGLSAGSGARMQMGRLWTAADRRAGGVHRRAAAGGDVSRVERAALPHRRPRVRERGVPDDAARDRSGNDAPCHGHDERASDVRYAAHARRSSSVGSKRKRAVAGVTFSLAGPGQELAAVLEVGGRAGAGRAGRLQHRRGERSRDTWCGSIASRPTSSTAFDVPLLMGRGFAAGDGSRARAFW